METLHKIKDVVLIFIIAFLINQHLQLIQRYERLQIACEKNEKSSCPPCSGINSLIQSSTVHTANLATVSSSSSSEYFEMYWAGSKTVHQSLTKDRDQSQMTESFSSTSQSEGFLIDPKETTLKTSFKSETETHRQLYNEVFTELRSDMGQVVKQQITALQSSEEISRQTLKNFQNKTKSALLHSSSSPFSFSQSHASTQRPPSLQSDSGDSYLHDYHKLPVEQTHSSSIDAGNNNIQREFPSIRVTSDSRETKDKTISIQKSSVMPDIFDGSLHTSKMPLHIDSIPAKTTMLKSKQSDMPLSFAITDEEDSKEQTLRAQDDPNESEVKASEISSSSLSNTEYDENLSIKPDDITSTLDDISPGSISEEFDASFFDGSSAVCGERSGSKHCVFKNICYHIKKKDFIFLKGPDTFIEKDASQDIQNVFTLKLSTLSDHNAFMFPIIVLPVTSLSNLSFAVIKKKSITISRFKPDNIMHVLHDDVVPLHHTMQEFNFSKKANVFDGVVIFTDVYEDGDYFELYSSLSSTKPLSLERLNISHPLICFHDIHVGLLTSTTWYQYGFIKPQGPLNDLDPQTFSYVHEASQYIRKHFDEPCFLCKDRDYLVFLSRKDNRLIMNEGDLIRALSQSTKLKVFSLSLETHSLADIITIVQSSQGLIGMHGSLMSMIIFLSPGSIVIELFPYGVNALHYTPFRTFATLSGSSITYRSWTNPDRQGSVPHPEKTPYEGGIQHLPVHVQKEIETQTEVPQHICCSDPSWLYHIYQDTFVNVSAIISLSLEAIETQNLSFSKRKNFSTLVPDIPGSVENVQCVDYFHDYDEKTRMKKQYTLSWESNWGLSYHPSPQNLIYEIVIQELVTQESQVFQVPIDKVSYSFGTSPVTMIAKSTYNVWITVVVVDSGLRSQSKHVHCGQT